MTKQFDKFFNQKVFVLILVQLAWTVAYGDLGEACGAKLASLAFCGGFAPTLAAYGGFSSLRSHPYSLLEFLFYHDLDRGTSDLAK